MNAFLGRDFTGDPRKTPEADVPAGTVCKTCNPPQPQPVKGLRILPVVRTLVRRSLMEAPRQYLENVALEDLAQEARTDTSLQEHRYMLRTLPMGYLYVFKPGEPPNSRWNQYEVDSSGMLTPFVRQGLSERFLVIDPDKHGEVWMAFSYFRWTTRVLDRYAENQKNCRFNRMDKVDVKAAAAGLPVKGFKSGRQLKEVVANHASEGNVRAIDKSIELLSNKEMLNLLMNTSRESQERNEDKAHPVFFPSGLLSSTLEKLPAEAAEKLARDLAPPGVIVILTDTFGLALKVKTSLDAEVRRKNEHIVDHQREYSVAGHILSARKWFNQNGQGDVWNKRYQPHYRSGLESRRVEYETKVAEYAERIQRISADAAILNKPLGHWWHDFDDAHDPSVIERQVTSALCICPCAEGTLPIIPPGKAAGPPVGDQSLRKLWDGWLREDPSDPNATLWGALTALDFDLGAYLSGKKDKYVEAFKAANDGDEFSARLKRRTHDGSLKIIGSAMANQLIRTRLDQPELYDLAVKRFLRGVSGHVRMTVVERTEWLTHTQVEWALHEAAGISNLRLLKMLKAEIKKPALLLHADSVDGSPPPKPVVVWLTEDLAKKLPHPLKIVEGAPLGDSNPYRVMTDTKNIGSLLNWFGTIVHSINLVNSLQVVSSGSSTPEQKEESWFALINATLSLVGFSLELYASSRDILKASFTKLWAARFAALAGVVEVANALRHSRTQLDAGNQKAAKLYLAVAGITAFTIAWGLRMAFVGVTFWVSFPLTIALTLAIVGFQGWADASASDDLEIWLMKSIWGTGDEQKKYKTQDEETAALIQLIYGPAMKIEAKKIIQLHSGIDARFSIGVPGAEARGSAIHCKVTLLDKTARTFGTVFDGVIRPVVQGSRAATPSSSLKLTWHQPPSVTQGDSGLQFGGHCFIQIEGFAILSFKLKVEISYFPDLRQMPGLVLPLEGKAIKEV